MFVQSYTTRQTTKKQGHLCFFVVSCAFLPSRLFYFYFILHLIAFQGECDQSFGADFEFDIHSKELIVGEIFVRIYNEQPTFPLEVRGLEIQELSG